MPRVINTTFLEDLEAVNAEDIEVVLLTITFPAVTVRLVRDVVDYVWHGRRYLAAMFELEFLSDDEKEPHGALRVPNVDRIIGESILTLDEPPTLRIDVLEGREFSSILPYIVLGGGFEAYGGFAYGEETHVEPEGEVERVTGGYEQKIMFGDPEPIITAEGLYLKNVRCTAQVIEADISSLELSVEPFPGLRATKNILPGLYR